MSDLKFDLPLRIHWRPGSEVSPAIVESIRKANPLAVTVHVEDVEQLAATGLPWEGIPVVVIHNGWRKQTASLPALDVHRWEFPVRGPDEAMALASGGFAGADPARAALRWYPVRGKLRHLAPILELAARYGCSVTLPNRPADVITSEEGGTFPDPDELDDGLFGAVRSAAALLQPGKIRVHDFILTRALGLESMEPSGCEAANAIAFIDGEGIVYPCETLGVPMGDLGREELEAIWASPLRARVRTDVGKMPGVCVRCPELTMCRGGCRGAVYHLKGHYLAPDPMCPLSCNSG
ncbi:MAG: SPASM domain-containing protein [bacterium]|nr:SPASM domain-containing protein [bacterium]